MFIKVVSFLENYCLLHMFLKIISLENLFSAWREFRRGKRGKCDVQNFECHLEDNIFSLRQELENRTYRHGQYEQFNIFDPKFRVIHKAMVRDRLAHHAVYRVLNPVFERSFIFDSYSCRVGKGTHKAVDRLEQFARKVSQNYSGPCWALKCDIKKFFASVDHKILFKIIARRISDLRALRLLGEIIKSYPNGGGY